MIIVKIISKKYLNHMKFEQRRYVEISKRESTAFLSTWDFRGGKGYVQSLQIDKQTNNKDT
jgi:hypothetical protein